MSSRKALACKAIVAAAGLFLSGCAEPFHFPAQSLSAAAKGVGAARAYDTNGNGKADFFIYTSSDGRFDRIGYDYSGNGAVEEIVKLDAIPARRCRHLVIIVDGFGYDLVKKHYESGHLRLFYPPSRLVAPYPVMTDLAMEDFLDYMPCRAYEAMYYDRQANRIAGGSLAYLAGENEPYNRLLHYRAGLKWVPFIYLYPKSIFGRELNEFKRAFDKAETKEMLAYFASTAGMGTVYGAAGQIECLRKFERLINQIIYETRGMTRVTLMGDHGHGYEPLTRIDFKRQLAERGWRLTKSIKRPRDVAMVRFGLTTYASFFTRSRAQLARDLSTIKGVTIVSYADKDTVVVLGPDPNSELPSKLPGESVSSRLFTSRGKIRGVGLATIREKAGRYLYEPIAGDPLLLMPILAKLKPDADGYYDADELLKATGTHIYPAPLQRIWRAHFGLAEHAADVIVSLEDPFCVGSRLFAAFVKAASTHGSLNYKNSVTFIMSTAGPLPPLMRAADVPKNMTRLFGRPWPMGK
ncbi:MAG: hypothetical protein ACYTF6_00125 [Planctomycetota bacterium]|jgi:hypothetical protein